MAAPQSAAPQSPSSKGATSTTQSPTTKKQGEVSLNPDANVFQNIQQGEFNYYPSWSYSSMGRSQEEAEKLRDDFKELLTRNCIPFLQPRENGIISREPGNEFRLDINGIKLIDGFKQIFSESDLQLFRKPDHALRIKYMYLKVKDRALRKQLFLAFRLLRKGGMET